VSSTTTSVRRIAVASFVGTAIEFYDFYIYGTAAALVVGAVFFPSFSPLAGTLAAFATSALVCLVSVALLRETKDADFTDGLEVPRSS
jgi:hypothetical protein